MFVVKYFLGSLVSPLQENLKEESVVAAILQSSVGSQVIFRSNKNKNLQASNFVISVCMRIFRTRRKRAFSLRGIIRVNYARRRLDYEANLNYRHFYSKNSRFFSFFVKSNTVTLFFSFGILKYSV